MKTTTSPLYSLAWKWGHLVCHQKPARSFRVGGRQFPVCARCAGIYAGILLGLAISFFYLSPLLACAVLMVPLLVDSLAQALTQYESSNGKRLITGLLFGYAIFTGLSVIFTT